MRQVALSCHVSASTVSDTMMRATQAGMGWPLPEEMDDGALEALLYAGQHSCEMCVHLHAVVAGHGEVGVR